MKKIIIFFLLFISFVGFGQVISTTYSAEVYSRSSFSGKWLLEKSNEDVRIPIILYEDEIYIQAERKVHYKFDKYNKENISEQRINGNRYNGYDVTNDKLCTIEVCHLINTNYFVISIIYDIDGINLRYFINSKD